MSHHNPSLRNLPALCASAVKRSSHCKMFVFLSLLAMLSACDPKQDPTGPA